MLTAEEIQSIEFSKAVRGYSAEEVDVFLDKVTVEFAQLQNELTTAKAQLAECQETIEKYKSQESMVLSTLEAAKSLMSDISASAEKRADILIKNAELDAELKTRAASETVERLQQEEKLLTDRVSSMKSRLRSVLQSELDRLDLLGDDFFGGTARSNDAQEEQHANLDESAQSFLQGFGSSFDIEPVKLNEEEKFKTIINPRRAY